MSQKKRDRLCHCRDFISVDFSPFCLFHLFHTGQLILVELFCCVLFGLQCLFLVFVSVSSYDELIFCRTYYSLGNLGNGPGLRRASSAIAQKNNHVLFACFVSSLCESFQSDFNVLFGQIYDVTPCTPPLCHLFLIFCGRYDQPFNFLHILQKNIREESEVAFPFACFVFHAVSPRPGLVKLLALSNFQARRRALGVSCFTGRISASFSCYTC